VAPSAAPCYAGDRQLESRRDRRTVGVQIRTCPPHGHEVSNVPRHHEIERQRALDAFDRTQLQCLYSAGILEYVEKSLDFPARPVPVDQFNDGFDRIRAAVGQQTPFDRFDAGTHIALACHDAGHGDRRVFTSRQCCVFRST